MLSFDSITETILASDYKLLYWLFEVTDSAATVHYWSTKTVPDTVYDSQAYTFKVLPDSFKRVHLSDPDIESENVSILADTYFEISNKDNTYSSTDFDGSEIVIKLVVSDGSNTELLASWGMTITQCTDLDQRLGFNCEDFLQPFLEGEYPNTELVSSIYPAYGDPEDDLCLPVIYGTAYIPIRSQWLPDGDSSGYVDSSGFPPEDGGERYYILGKTTDAFTVSEIRSPRDFGRSIFTSDEFTFTYSDEMVQPNERYYKTMRPQIGRQDDDSSGTIYKTGVWRSGDKMVDPFFKITRTGSSTDPATIVANVLQDFGVSAAQIDTAGSFAAAAAVYSGWGLTFNGAFFRKIPRREVLAKLLIMCNSTLRVTDKIELHPLTLNNADSVATHTTAEIIKDSFSYNKIIAETSDSGTVGFQVATEPVDQLAEITVPAKSSSNNISGDVLNIDWVQDSQDVQRIGSLHLQRKYLGNANPSYMTKLSELGPEPNDIITVSGTRYGGPHYIKVTEVSINKDGKIEYGGTTHSADLDNWNDLNPAAVGISPEYIVYDETWSTVVTGPTTVLPDGTSPSDLPGELVIGAAANDSQIILDPTNTNIVLNDDGTDRLTIGHLGGTDYGLQVRDPSGNVVVQVDTSQAVFAGWSLTQTQIYSVGNAIVLDSDDKFISINNTTFGAEGIQMEYNDGDPQFYVGNGSDSYIKFEEGQLTSTGIQLTASAFDEIYGGDFPDTDEFIFTVYMGAGQTFYLPLINPAYYPEALYDFTVDWGDGSESEINGFSDTDKNHQYASTDTYIIKIRRTIEGMSFGSSQWSQSLHPNRTNLREIQQWGCLIKGNYGLTFYECTQMTVTATDAPDLTGCTTLSGMFRNCDALTNIPNLSTWDVSGIENFSSMFSRAYYFEAQESDGSDDLDGWDTSSATDMNTMFRDCYNFNSTLDDWEVGLVENFRYMFYGCSDFTSDLSLWDTSSATEMDYMFSYCSSFNSDLSDWEVGSVEDFKYMFRSTIQLDTNLTDWDISGATNLSYMFYGSYLDYPLDWDVAHVINMEGMFANSHFDSDISGWNVGNVENMNSMFASNTYFDQAIGDSSGWDTSSVTNMAEMFRGATAFNQDLNDWDVSSVTTINNMFEGANLFNGDISDWTFSASLTSFYDMFYNAPAFNCDISGWDVSNITIFNRMFYGAIAFNQAIGGWDTSSATSMASMFRNADAFNQDLFWDVSSVTSISYMFYSAGAFNGDITGWVLSPSLISLYGMFYGAAAFNQDISSGDSSSGTWDVSNVSNFNSMFRSTIAFNKDISNWDVSSAQYMSSMFHNARAFDQPIDSWEVDNVTNMDYMFSGAWVFDQDLNSWDVRKVTTFEYMFSSALIFNSDISSWVPELAVNMEGMFQSAALFDIDISGWDVSLVSNFESMFYSAVAFDQDISTWTITAAYGMDEMFRNATAFDQDLGDWDVSNVASMRWMFDGTGVLSTVNWSNTLIGWEGISDLRSNVSLSGGTSKYSAGAAATARQALIDDHNWSITDGGQE